jgi:hypothetical protein
MDVFMQGMRRSGTTIFFDLFVEDGRFDCYYEPLAAAIKPAIGGGSEVRDVDLFENVRAMRAKLLAAHPELDDPQLLNYGAPRQAELEFETDAPEYIGDYLRLLCTQAEYSAIKFTRIYHKVGLLHAIDPDAFFIHLVRDPRRVTASYLFGKHQRNKKNFPDEATFFERVSEKTAWSSLRFSNYLLSTDEYARHHGLADFMRILLIWKDCFESTHRDGLACFGDRYLLLRHEDLATDPDGTLERLYAHVGRDLPEHVRAWARQHVRPPRPCYAARNSSWRRAFDELDLMPALEVAGYRPS